MTIIDKTEADMVAFRRNVYLTIQSSLDFQEAAHKLIKRELRPQMEVSNFFNIKSFNFNFRMNFVTC